MPITLDPVPIDPDGADLAEAIATLSNECERCGVITTGCTAHTIATGEAADGYWLCPECEG